MKYLLELREQNSISPFAQALLETIPTEKEIGALFISAWPEVKQKFLENNHNFKEELHIQRTGNFIKIEPLYEVNHGEAYDFSSLLSIAPVGIYIEIQIRKLLEEKDLIIEKGLTAKEKGLREFLKELSDEIYQEEGK